MENLAKRTIMGNGLSQPSFHSNTTAYGAILASGKPGTVYQSSVQYSSTSATTGTEKISLRISR